MASLTIERFPDELYVRLSRRAAANNRRVEDEVIQILSQALGERRLSILGLQGLGKELWATIDVDEHVDRERESWD